MVERYFPATHKDGGLCHKPSPMGEWVRHSDYETLERQLAEARAELKLAIAEREFWRVADKNSVERAEAAEAERDHLKASLTAIADYPYTFGRHVQRLKAMARAALTAGKE